VFNDRPQQHLTTWLPGLTIFGIVLAVNLFGEILA